jgi:hypothetical protein
MTVAINASEGIVQSDQMLYSEMKHIEAVFLVSRYKMLLYITTLNQAKIEG